MDNIGAMIVDPGWVDEYEKRKAFVELRRAFAVAIAQAEPYRENIARDAHALATECTRVWAELDAQAEKGGG